jgi:hypothetical protein
MFLVTVESSAYFSRSPFARADERPIRLFVRFVETLGPREFLSAVSLLLLDKTIKATDPNSLPLAVFEHFPIDMQLSALKQIIEEIPKLILRGSGTTGEPFLDLSACVLPLSYFRGRY